MRENQLVNLYQTILRSEKQIVPKYPVNVNRSSSCNKSLTVISVGLGTLIQPSLWMIHPERNMFYLPIRSLFEAYTRPRERIASNISKAEVSLRLVCNFFTHVVDGFLHVLHDLFNLWTYFSSVITILMEIQEGEVAYFNQPSFPNLI